MWSRGRSTFGRRCCQSIGRPTCSCRLGPCPRSTPSLWSGRVFSPPRWSAWLQHAQQPWVVVGSGFQRKRDRTQDVTTERRACAAKRSSQRAKKANYRQKTTGPYSLSRSRKTCRSTDTLACGPALEPQQRDDDSTIADNSASSSTCTAQWIRAISTSTNDQSRLIEAKRSKSFPANLIAVGVVLSYRMPSD